MSKISCLLAGFGGQGVLFAGKVMAYTGLLEDKEVSWLPSYGPEMRGGTANCSVCLADELIGSPLATSPDVLICMNQPSLDKFIDDMRPGTIIVADSTLVQNIPEREGVTVYAIPATKIAEDNELNGLGNMVLVGKLWAETHFCEQESLEAALKKCVPAKRAHLITKNLDAIGLGKLA